MMNAVDTEKLVFSQLLLFGFKHHSAGFRYLCTGLQLALEQPGILNEMTDKFYRQWPRFITRPRRQWKVRCAEPLWMHMNMAIARTNSIKSFCAIRMSVLRFQSL